MRACSTSSRVPARWRWRRSQEEREALCCAINRPPPAVSSGKTSRWFAWRIVRTSAILHALERLVGEQFDLIFLDPPYHKGLIDVALEGMIRRNQLAEGGLIVAETAQDEGFDLPEGLTFTDERKYGKSRLHFIERA